MTNKNVKRSSTLYVNRGLQIKAIVRNYYTAFTMAKVQNTTLNASKEVKQQELFFRCWQERKWCLGKCITGTVKIF